MLAGLTITGSRIQFHVVETRIFFLNWPSPTIRLHLKVAWRTTQDRLIPELWFAGITSMVDANAYLEQEYLPKYWHQRNTVKPRSEETRYRQLQSYEDLSQIFCIKHERHMRSDHTIHFENNLYKVKPPSFGSLKNKKIMVHVYEDFTIAMYYGHIKLEIEKIVKPTRRWLDPAA